MASDRIHTRLPVQLAAFVANTVDQGEYETPSEYIRDLIRRDMDRKRVRVAAKAIQQGLQDVAAGRVFASSGSFQEDRARFAQRETEGWKAEP